MKFLILLLLFLFIYRSCFYDECKGNAVCYYLKAKAAEENAEYENALLNYRMAILTDRRYIEAYNSRGLLYQKLDNHKKAIKDFTKIIEIDNKNWMAFHNRANSHTTLGKNKYSVEYRKAMDDYDFSIKLNENNENAISFFNRGLLKNKMEIYSCDDFVYSCFREYSDGCEVYEKSCYPMTGNNMYSKYFGDGVVGGRNKFIFNNIQGDDDCLIVIRNLNSIIDGTYARVKSQFVRKGQILTVEGLPNGTYFFERMIGSYWLDNIKSNKTIREGAFYSDERFLRYRKDYFYLSGGGEHEITVVRSGGNMNPENISEEEFMN